jgi:hypothetical protein
MLHLLKNQTESIELSKEDYEKLQQAIKDLDAPFHSV